MKPKAIHSLLIILIGCICFLNTSNAQTDTSSVKPAIRNCADTMVKAFSTGDYATMERFTNANLVKMLGGKEKYISFLKESMTEDGVPTIRFEEAAIGKILKVVKTNNGFQCLVEQKLVLIMGKSRITAISPLHGFANNTGKFWKFADVGDKAPEAIKQLIPDFDKRLIIPKKTTTVEKI